MKNPPRLFCHILLETPFPELGLILRLAIPDIDLVLRLLTMRSDDASLTLHES